MATPLTLDTFRHEARLAMRITNRDRWRRLATVTLALGLCWYAGAGGAALLIAALLALSEASGYAATRLEPPPDRDVPLPLALWVWANHATGTVVYLLPALALAARPDSQFMLAGFMWLFGCYVYIANNYVVLPFHNWGQMVPAFLMGPLAVAAAAGADPAGPWGWLPMAGLFVLYAANTVETMSAQKEFHGELTQARAEARARLGALEHLARHDPLTGLLNRQAFDEGLARLLLDRRAGRAVAVMLVDLDGFKPINDTYSHAAGDAVLAALGARLAALAGEDGLAARLGGDEFALALPGVPSREAALEVATRLVREMERPVPHGATALRLGGSVGVALSGPRTAGAVGAPEVPALCAEADRAMYRAKAAARAGSERRPVLFDPADFPPRPTAEDRRRLQAAIAGRAIAPRYEPVVLLATGEVAGFEARSRWGAPPGPPPGTTPGAPPGAPGDAGALPPAAEELPPEAFLPLVAEFGLGADLLLSVARQVMEDIDALLDAGLDPGRVSLDIPEVSLATHSGRQDFDRLLAAHPRARAHLVFEVGEAAFADRSGGRVRDALLRLCAAGLRVALDGVGTGGASFDHLRRLPFDEIKLSPALVADLGPDPSAEVLVTGLVSIAQGLGARPVAEGVATEAQRRHLLRLGCRLGQGPLFGAASPLGEARARLQAQDRSRRLA